LSLRFYKNYLRRLKEAFSLFDKDNNGYIDIAELDSMMNNLGETLSTEQVKVSF